ncbi:PREDICTED: disease resistance protein ADR1 [Camelina sativa]|uniref:Disease resistance protein ADR1 n=1 Tax=Camelina sativa TaxID=90675 RepID=A0ABM0VU96_CAMSA|nr:PREDICTED: disease resistance protein ADR1 [Camelina sativa]
MASFIDLFASDITTHLIKLLVMVANTIYSCKGIAERLVTMIRDVQPTIREIQYSGVELSNDRQTQLGVFFETLEKARKLCEKVLRCRRWNPKHVYHANKMKDLEKKISRFLNSQILLFVLAEVCHLRVNGDRIERLLSERNDTLSFPETLMEIETVSDPAVQQVGLDLGKRKVKEMMFKFTDTTNLFGISGMSGSGKTTLAIELSRDDDVRGLFNNKVLFLTVSRSPNFENLESRIREFLNDGVRQRKLVILDDVWTRDSLDRLISKIRGSTTLVVSQSKLADPKTTYNVELLKEDEAMSLLCLCAFEQNSPPSPFSKILVKQVVDECKGLPLSLKVLGASLKNKPERYWEGVVKRLSRGEAVDETHESRVFSHIEESIENLDPKIRKCFLDMGVFPEDTKIPIDLLTNVWVERHDIDEETAFSFVLRLADKNLLTIVNNPRFGDVHIGYYDVFVTQHDVLRDLAIHMSNRAEVNRRERLLMPKRESVLPREWERNKDELFDAKIVSLHTGEMDWFDMDLPKAEVLILNFSSDNYFLPPFIGKMVELRMLVIINNGMTPARLHGFSIFDNLTKLRSLWLKRVHVPELSSSTIPLKNLRKMHLILCKVSNSFDRTTFDISHIFPSLSDLTIDHCDDLVELNSNISGMASLKSLNITNCPRITELPKNLSNLQSLERLRLYACLELLFLPVEICELPCLKYVDISQCISLSSLPENIGKLRTLEKIDMRGCSLLDLPSPVVSLESLRHVICDEEASSMWEKFKRFLPELCIEIPEKRFTVDWLDD